MARRDAERIRREKAVEAALAEFYQAQGEIERIREDAARKSAPFQATAGKAVRALDRLGETRTGIAELTGLSLAVVRAYVGRDGASTSARPPVQSENEVFEDTASISSMQPT
ncbi:MAG: hypothetical protein ACRDSS_07105 [Actinocrinis sp.]